MEDALRTASEHDRRDQQQRIPRWSVDQRLGQMGGKRECSGKGVGDVVKKTIAVNKVLGDGQ